MTQMIVPPDRYLSSGTVTLHCLDWGGPKPPLLLLTGILGTAFSFVPIANRLASHFRTVALTRRGSGKSSKPDAGYDVETLVGDIVGAMDALHIGSAHIVAFSLAGIEATSLAIDYPERVRTVVYLDAAYDNKATAAVSAKDPLNAYLVAPSDKDLESLDSFVSYVKRTNPDMSALWDEWLDREILESVEVLPDQRVKPRTSDLTLAQLRATSRSYSPDYARVAAPALAIYALFDECPTKPKSLPPEVAERVDEYWREVVVPADRKSMEQFRKNMPNGRVLELPNTYHACFRHKEDEVFNAIVDFLSEQDADYA